jgi:hypothetical protein
MRSESSLTPRDAAAQDEFPYRAPTTCYIEVHADGRVTQGADEASCDRAKAGQSRLFAVWPGQWRSDLFAVEPEAFAKARGYVHDQERTGLADHRHEVEWWLSPYRDDNPRAQYVTIRVRFLCDCTPRDIEAFAKHMQAQRGWDVGVRRGWGGGGDEIYCDVKRATLDYGSRIPAPPGERPSWP